MLACRNKRGVGVKDKRGIALLMTLIVVGLMSASVVSFVRLVNIDAKLSENTYHYAQAEILARAGLKGAMTILAMDDADVDALDDSWADFRTYSALAQSLFEEGGFTGTIEDLAGRLDVNALITNQNLKDIPRNEVLRRLLTHLELDPAALIPPILDWLDSNDDPEFGGAEDSYYQGLENPYRCANGRLYSFGQLSLIKGLTSEILYGTEEQTALRSVLTVYSDSGKININTVGKDLLMSLDEEITDAVAQEIIDYRAEESFEKLDQLRNITSLTPEARARIIGLLSVTSSYFYIQVEGYFRESRVAVTAVVQRTSGNVKLIFYKAG